MFVILVENHKKNLLCSYNEYKISYSVFRKAEYLIFYHHSVSGKNTLILKSISSRLKIVSYRQRKKCKRDFSLAKKYQKYFKIFGFFSVVNCVISVIKKKRKM